PPIVTDLPGAPLTGAERFVPMPSTTDDTLLLTELLADPLDLIDRLEAAAVDLSDPYWARIEVLMRSTLRQVGDVDDVADANHLRETSAGRTLEMAARFAGFALAFEYLRPERPPPETKGHDAAHDHKNRPSVHW